MVHYLPWTAILNDWRMSVLQCLLNVFLCYLPILLYGVAHKWEMLDEEVEYFLIGIGKI